MGVLYEVVYSDAKAFRELFRMITGLSPLEYNSRYNNSIINTWISLPLK